LVASQYPHIGQVWWVNQQDWPAENTGLVSGRFDFLFFMIGENLVTASSVSHPEQCKPLIPLGHKTRYLGLIRPGYNL
jgi:hypothetical protein